MMTLRVPALLLALVLALTACSAASTPPPTTAPESTAAAAAPTAAAAPAEGGAYPAPAGAYPGPAGAPESTAVPDTGPLQVPQPSSSDVGNARGTLLRVRPDGTTEPVARGVLYLGTLIRSDAGVEAMVSVDKTSAPSAVTNARGEFAFTDVAPGRYGLMFDTFQGDLLLNNPETNGDLIIEITGGQILDLGELRYPLPE